jgi:hypothetical protein
MRRMEPSCRCSSVELASPATLSPIRRKFSAGDIHGLALVIGGTVEGAGGRETVVAPPCKRNAASANTQSASDGVIWQTGHMESRTSLTAIAVLVVLTRRVLVVVVAFT